ncbi:MAG TPA: hypothetical protein VIN59_00575 [Alphaproteobacteria bacterium]
MKIKPQPQCHPLPRIDFFIAAAELHDHDGVGIGIMTYRQAGPVISIVDIDYNARPKDMPEYLNDIFDRLAYHGEPVQMVTCQSLNGRKRSTHSYLVPKHSNA